LLTIVSSFVVPAFGITDFKFLRVPATITPTYIDPTTGVARAWVVKAAGYAQPFPTWGVFLMIAPALGGTLLGFLDQNLTEVLVNRKDRMFKKPPAYHLTNFICGTVLYPICAVLGLPPTHAATVRSLAHVMAVTTTEVVPLPDGTGTTVRAVNVAEQRVTHLAIHVLIWISLAATAALAYVRRSAARATVRCGRAPHAAPLIAVRARGAVTSRAPSLASAGPAAHHHRHLSLPRHLVDPRQPDVRPPLRAAHLREGPLAQVLLRAGG
jgi:hypothetical protein